MSSKLREALLEIHNQLKDRLAGRVTHESMELRIKNIINAALAEPMRNCDVGSAEEQLGRFIGFCTSQKPFCIGCPIKGKGTCSIHWGQMPYLKGKRNEQ